MNADSTVIRRKREAPSNGDGSRTEELPLRLSATLVEIEGLHAIRIEGEADLPDRCLVWITCERFHADQEAPDLFGTAGFLVSRGSIGGLVPVFGGTLPQELIWVCARFQANGRRWRASTWVNVPESSCLDRQVSA